MAVAGYQKLQLATRRNVNDIIDDLSKIQRFWNQLSAGAGNFLRADGTVALTANWDAGSFKITAETLESDVAGGTPPLVVASNTLVANLNADLLDGVEEAAFSLADGTRDFSGVVVGVDPVLSTHLATK